MSLDLSEQIGNVYQAQLRMGSPVTNPEMYGFMGTADPISALHAVLLTAASGTLGAPGTAVEALGYTFPGAAAKQRGRLEAEVKGGFPFTRKRIKGAPTFAKRKLSTWNRDVKKAYKAVKAQKNQFGPKGKINSPKKAFAQIVKMVSKYRKGRKLGMGIAARQITRVLKR